MANFPKLSTGAITQYPVGLTSGQSVQAIRFLDGSDQRYLMHKGPLRQWQIRLEMLNETEIQQFEAFFTDVQGDYATFDFPDPFSGTFVPLCRLGAPGQVSEYFGVNRSTTSLWVMETYG